MFIKSSEVVLKSALAGTKANAYWRQVVAPIITTLSQHYRQLARKEAYMVSMSIIPYTHADRLLEKVLAKPSRAQIPWDTMVDQYGVDRQYIAISMLAALERKAKDPAALAELQRPRKDNFSLLNQCLGLFAPNITSKYIAAMAETGRFPITLARFNPEYTARLAADAAQKLERIRQGERAKNRMYKEGETWAGWRQVRAAHVRTKAMKIADTLIATQTEPTQPQPQPQPQPPLIKVLADAAKPKGTTKRPALAPLMIYYHKHVWPALRSRAAAGGTDTSTVTLLHATIQQQAAMLGSAMPQTNGNHVARCLISELTCATTGSRFEPIWDGDADPRLKPYLASLATPD